jgi:hypothetical protein
VCTTISSTTAVRGAGKGAAGWFPVTEAVVAYDHPSHCGGDHALLIDFADYARGTGARVAVELDLESGRALLEQLRSAIAAAEASGV